jgi:hypothetical protein
MKVSIARGGGLAGLVRKTELAVDALPDDAAGELKQKLDRAGLGGGARAAGVTPPGERPRPHPDELSYSVTIEDEGGERTIEGTETSLPREVRELVQWVDARPERHDELKPPGA